MNKDIFKKLFMIFNNFILSGRKFISPADFWAFFTSLIIVSIRIDGRELTAPNSIKFVTGVEGGPNVRTSV